MGFIQKAFKDINMAGTVIISILLAGAVACIIVKLYKDKKSGKSCSCGSCPHCKMCGKD